MYLHIQYQKRDSNAYNQTKKHQQAIHYNNKHVTHYLFALIAMNGMWEGYTNVVQRDVARYKM